MVNFQIAFNQFSCFLVCLAAYQILFQKGLRGRRRIKSGGIFPSPPNSRVDTCQKPRSNRVKPTQFQGQTGPLFGTDLYFMDIYRMATLSLNVQLFFLFFLCTQNTVVTFVSVVNDFKSTATFVY